MIALLFAWLIAVVLLPATALVLFLCKRKGMLKRFAIECAVVLSVSACLVSLVPRPVYPVGHDTIHVFGDGRFQIWATDDIAYVFSDEGGDSLDRAVFGVIKWAVDEDGYCLITRDGRYHFVNSRTGARTTYSAFKDIPPAYWKTFRKMGFWGPYGQLWEDLSHAHGIWFVLAGLWFVWVIRIVMLLATNKRKDQN